MADVLIRLGVERAIVFHAADGMDEEDAVVVRTWGEPPMFGFEPKDHTELGSASGWIDMARGARLSGSRFAYRIGDVAVTEMALYQYVLSKLRGKGFLTVLPPILVGERAMYGTGFLPTEESNLYRLEKDELVYNTEGCIELGACTVVCKHIGKGAIRWSYPRGSYGVGFRFG